MRPTWVLTVLSDTPSLWAIVLFVRPRIRCVHLTLAVTELAGPWHGEVDIVLHRRALPEVATQEPNGDPPQVTVRRAIPDLRGNGYGGPPPREPKLPKTDTGIRTIGIDEETVRVLREHRERSEELARKLGLEKLPPRAYVFWPYNEGPLMPYAPQSITKMLRTLAGEGGLRPHQLRHFSVTQLLAAGVPEVEVMGRHGHASASSMKPYRHYIRAKDRMSTEAMRDVLDAGPQSDA